MIWVCHFPADRDSALALQPGYVSGSHFHTLLHSTVFPPYSWIWKTWFHLKKGGLCWDLIRLAFCLLRQDWIWTQVLTSLRSKAPKLVPEPFQVPLYKQNSPSQLIGRGASASQINTVQWHLTGAAWARDTEPETRRWKHYPPNPRQAPRNVTYRRAQTETEKAPKLSGSKFIKQASSNWADSSPKLSPENKGGLPYIPFRAGYRNEEGCTACPICNHMLFHWLL
jgi:hypothetical protein